MRRFFAILFITLAAAFSSARAGDAATGYDVLAVIDHGDTIPFELLPIQFVYPNPVNTYDEKTRKFFWKTVRDVKKTLPYAKQIAAEVKAIDEATKGMSDSQRKSYMKAHEDDLVNKFKPALKKLTLKQGKILIKLVDRECGQSSYELIKAYRGGFRAAFWQGFAKMLGADLKANYNVKEEEVIEAVINLVENGQL